MRSKFDPSGMTALVVDQNHHQRGMTLEQLRLMGFGTVVGASNFDKAWEALSVDQPQVVLVEWMEPRDLTLAFIRRIRNDVASPSPDVSLFVLTSRGALTDVESAREAGVDGYLRKPVSVTAIQARVRHVFVRPKQEPTEAQIDRRSQRARVLAAALEARSRGLAPDDAKGLHQINAAARGLNAIAAEIGDSFLGFGARELSRYLDACERGLDLDTEALCTHAAALFQIALLPSAHAPERERLANSLKRLVDKKLGQAA